MGEAEAGDGLARAGPEGGRKPRALSAETAAWLRGRLQSTFTTRGLTAELAERGVTRRLAVTAVD